MSKFKNALNARDNHIWTLRTACGVMLVLLVLSMLGWMMSPRNLTIHNPPDLRSGSFVRGGRSLPQRCMPSAFIFSSS